MIGKQPHDAGVLIQPDVPGIGGQKNFSSSRNEGTPWNAKCEEFRHLVRRPHRFYPGITRPLGASGAPESAQMMVLA